MALTRGRPKAPLVVGDADRETLTHWTRCHESGRSLALRARIVLESSAGVTNQRIAASLRVTTTTVGKWRTRFIERGPAGLLDEPRCGAPRTITDQQVEAVVVRTLEPTPEGVTYWSVRSMAAESGLSRSTVHRIWRTHGLQPHRAEELERCNDSRVTGKVGDTPAAVNSNCLQTSETEPATRKPTSPQHLRDLTQLRRVRDRIDREYEQPLDVEALARGADMSAGHLSRAFRLAYGESPYSYLMTRRIERAMALLRRGDLSVTEVCFAVGCSSLGTFSSRFADLVGVSPSAYRRLAARETAGILSCVAKQVTRPVRNREAPPPEPRLD